MSPRESTYVIDKNMQIYHMFFFVTQVLFGGDRHLSILEIIGPADPG